MEFIIAQKEEKPLVERTEIALKIKNFKATPSNLQVQEALAKLLNQPQNLIIVKNIHQNFGENEATALAYAYKSEEALKKFEPKKKEKVKAEEAKEKNKE